MNLVQTLALGMRLCFNLFVIDGYKHTEIAQMLGIKEGTSKSNLAMAKKKLRNLISITQRNRQIS
ncbi:MAG: DNA-directed RNA polymerase specialized sigma24 family protein [Saprospiraceae bacterium]|jgi:DNA-directed RNA polymerase specialized sigma24 family protein